MTICQLKCANMAVLTVWHRSCINLYDYGTKHPGEDRTTVEMPMAKYTVSNINGDSKTAVLPSGYSSWIDFWEKKTGLKRGICKHETCLSAATDGAHVNVSGHGNYWYIVPLCHKHNLSSDSFKVNGPLVPVNPDLSILW